MGFFQAMGRIIQGKPVFQENDGTTAHTDPAIHEAGEEHEGIIKNNPSTFPVLRIEDINPDGNEHEYALRVMMKNEWHKPVIVQTVRAFGQTHTLGIWLQAEDAKEALIYSGAPFKQQPGFEVLVEYKTEYEGDYFQAIHDVKYLYNSSTAHYEVSSLQLRMPIRDIYG